MTIKTCVFNAYGPLFDVGAAARIAADEQGRAALAAKTGELAEFWRQKQLQYTWLRAVSDNHIDFWTVTENGFDWASERIDFDAVFSVEDVGVFKPCAKV